MAAARSVVLAITVATAALGTVIGARATARQTASGCPATPTPVISSQPPTDVCIPDGFTQTPMEYFDDYSWRLFVSLVWPADPARRGAIAANRSVSAPGPRVFETYKSMWEIFHDDGSAPAPFAAYERPAYNPCRVPSIFGDLTIGSASGIDDIGQAGGGVLEAPLAAQNGRYVRTLTLFNQRQFDHILTNRFYLRSELPDVPRPRPETPVINFPMGSIAVKTAWVDVEGLPGPLVRRFYTRTMTVKRATGEGCERRSMGLVGMHIAQKTPSRPQWIWSSFEQRDTVPPAWPDSPGSYVLHDGTPTPMPETNPLSLVPLAPEPVTPFNVERAPTAPLLTSTELTNFAYQRLLAGTPWQYYRLILTQWPRMDGNQATPIPPTTDGSVPNTFPGTDAFSAFANVTMETFDQRTVQLGCMNCHNRARMNADFMWTLLDHAHPARFPPAATAGGPGRASR
jgi:hypothetical protein